MSFISLIYLFLFFPIAIAIHTISPKKIKNNALLLLSLFFYSWGDPRYLILILFSVAITWFGVNRMYAIKNRREEAKFYMVCLIVLNVAILAFYKYYGFLIDNVNAIFRTSLSIIDLPLPFGISFYTFKIISYIVDVYTRRTKPQKRFSDFALYVTIFPQIGAGPIVQYADMEKELITRKLSVDKFGFGVEKFIFGLGKKALIANNMALIWTQVKDMPNLEMSSLTAWIGIVAFTLQIYFDFSGYSDMAIGVGYMLGFKWEENFNYPYISKSATEFWRRWHISLGSWFKRYIYFPLGGSKCSPAMQFRNIFVVWMVTGLWHGANWNFIIWGLYFGIIIYLEKTVLANAMSKLGSKMKTVYCLLIVVLGWVLFDFQSVTQILKFYSNLFVLGANGVVDSTAIYLLRTNWRIIVPAIIGSTPFALKLIDNIKCRFGRNGYFFVSIFYIFIVVLSVASLVGESYSPFLYFKF
ncbi:MBOAT family O-acyltransferase [Peptostreptococcus sp. D1]|uniref:MBOAT family O-acyltransferase n=1 Tax=Peptostreptococcus sp. D1 TaxID=72304 RepID=UPI0008E9306F|nr:MBOAT family O-acyltransferase [Peptostreptococcus sp. D1]SFE72487.1 alginate O-acetyltransferase complex protein AlgI [Peptostreptococcus sp. D1]